MLILGTVSRVAPLILLPHELGQERGIPLGHLAGTISFALAYRLEASPTTGGAFLLYPPA